MAARARHAVAVASRGVDRHAVRMGAGRGRGARLGTRRGCRGSTRAVAEAAARCHEGLRAYAGRVAVAAGAQSRAAVAVAAAADAVRMAPVRIALAAVRVGHHHGVIAATCGAYRVGGVGAHKKATFELHPCTAEKRLGLVVDILR